MKQLTFILLVWLIVPLYAQNKIIDKPVILELKSAQEELQRTLDKTNRSVTEQTAIADGKLNTVIETQKQYANIDAKGEDTTRAAAELENAIAEWTETYKNSWQTVLNNQRKVQQSIIRYRKAALKARNSIDTTYSVVKHKYIKSIRTSLTLLKQGLKYLDPTTKSILVSIIKATSMIGNIPFTPADPSFPYVMDAVYLDSLQGETLAKLMVRLCEANAFAQVALPDKIAYPITGLFDTDTITAAVGKMGDVTAAMKTLYDKRGNQSWLDFYFPKDNTKPYSTNTGRKEIDVEAETIIQNLEKKLTSME